MRFFYLLVFSFLFELGASDYDFIPVDINVIDNNGIPVAVLLSKILLILKLCLVGCLGELSTIRKKL